ncbi:hypothetical protein ABZZ20_22950 [Streptomyces sp. NPDC006430]|uniref:hypothetical protein n=1 Tax=Streptomyces sp. NPDC006430 TaxID=3154299 RepID=UPI0033A8FD79
MTVWALDTTSDAVGGYSAAQPLPMLDAAERERAGQLLRAGDRRRYLASSVGLRVLIGGYLGLAPADVVLVRET